MRFVHILVTKKPLRTCIGLIEAVFESVVIIGAFVYEFHREDRKQKNVFVCSKSCSA